MTTTAIALRTLATTSFEAKFIKVSSIKTSQTGKSFVTVTCLGSSKLIELNSTLEAVNGESEYKTFIPSNQKEDKCVFSFNLWFANDMPTERIKFVSELEHESVLKFDFNIVDNNEQGEFDSENVAAYLNWLCPISEQTGQDKLKQELAKFKSLKSDAELRQEAKLAAMIEQEKKALEEKTVFKQKSAEQTLASSKKQADRLALLLAKLQQADDKPAETVEKPAVDETVDEADKKDKTAKKDK